MLKALAGTPGSFIDTVTGKVVQIKKYSVWESSDRFEGTSFRLDTSKREFIIDGISFSADKMPSTLELQQQVVLRIGSGSSQETVFEAPLFTILFLPARGETERKGKLEPSARLAAQDVRVTVTLTERPVEGCGLRLHLRGYARQ